MNKYVLTILIIGVLIIGLLAGVFYLFSRPGVPTETPVSEKPEGEIKEELSDWKTYSNEEYGFEFQYPAYAEISFEENPIYLGPPEPGDEIIPRARYLNPFGGPIVVPSAVLGFKFINPATSEEAMGVNLKLSIFSLKQYKQASYHFGEIAYDVVNEQWYSKEDWGAITPGTPITEELIAERWEEGFVKDYLGIPRIFTKTEQGVPVHKILAYDGIYVTDSYVLINTGGETVFEFRKTTGENEYYLSLEDNQKFVDRILEDLPQIFSTFWFVQ